MTDAVSSDGTPSGPPAPADLRASDADREKVAEVLRDALAEGRLDMEEFEERLEATYKARTYGELVPVTRDLPSAGVSVPAVLSDPAVSLTKEPRDGGGWAGRIVGGDGSSSWAVAIMSGFQRKGRWTAPKRFNSFAFWGGGEIDLREADFADREIEINCIAIMGGMNVVVPPGVEVVVRGIGIMGGFDHREEGVPADPGAPRVIVTGFAFWGGVGVERKLTRAERLRQKEARRQDKLDRKASRRGLESTLREAMEERHELVQEHLEERRERHEERRELHRERREARRDERHDRHERRRDRRGY
ncbi:DUF1707 domain-containing protein [Streptomyces sp. NPDC048664]|uniref:DUF1707 SHOCT-like domain-containing protein n=1 Tax=Streptomyces sp. NPDC048664 TaxID=3154505 RepID=UPI00341D5949